MKPKTIFPFNNYRFSYLYAILIPLGAPETFVSLYIWVEYFENWKCIHLVKMISTGKTLYLLRTFNWFKAYYVWIVQFSTSVDLSDSMLKDLGTVVGWILLSQRWHINQTSIKRYKTVTLLLLWLMTKWIYVLCAGC